MLENTTNSNAFKGQLDLKIHKLKCIEDSWRQLDNVQLYKTQIVIQGMNGHWTVLTLKSVNLCILYWTHGNSVFDIIESSVIEVCSDAAIVIH